LGRRYYNVHRFTVGRSYLAVVFGFAYGERVAALAIGRRYNGATGVFV